MTRLIRSITSEPLHAPTTHFPMALYPMAVVFDLLALTRQDGSLYTHAAFVVMLVATLMAGVAVTTGFLHLFRDVSPSSGVWRVAIFHMIIQLTAGSLLVASLILRTGHIDDAQPPALAILLAITGTAALLVGGWLGGRMVYAYGVGVAPVERQQSTDGDEH